MDDNRPAVVMPEPRPIPDGVSKQRRHQLKRRNEGLCGYEGCDVVTGRRYYCTEHKRARRQRTRAA